MDLPEQIDGILRDVGEATIGVYARHLGSEDVVAFGADRVMPTASAAKQFILLTYAQQVAGGRLDPGMRVEITATDHVLGSGVLRYCTPGLEPTRDDLAFLMITVSDNLATNVLLREVGGPDAVNTLMDALALPDARVHSPIIFGDPSDDDVLEFAAASTRDLAESFAICGEPERTGYPAGAAEHCKRILRRQQHLDKLPRHLPWSPHSIDFDFELPVTVYSKTGSYPGVSTDAALFETSNARWVAAVMASGLSDWKAGPDGPAERATAEIGQALWRAWGPSR